MRMIVAVIVLAVLVAVVYSAIARAQQRGGAGAKDPNVMRTLRLRVLQDPPGIDPKAPADAPVAALMDLGMGDATATVTATPAGDGSLYISSGGGVIGGIAHEPVRKAAIAFVNEAASLRSHLRQTTDFGYPAAGTVRFYLRTRNGVYMAERAEQTLSERKDPLSRLFAAGHEVITQLRLISQTPR